MHDCDVVVVNYNAGKLLYDCVASAFSAGARSVIVVDNDSTEGSVEYLEGRVSSGALIVIRNGKNLGFAAGCNVGAKASTAGKLLFLNPDSVLTPGALSTMVSVLDSSESIGMVGGLLCNRDGSEQPGGRRAFPTPKRAFVRAFGLARLARHFPSLFPDFLLYQDPLPSAPIPVEAISGACMLVKRAAVEDVGPLDEGYFLHCEDLDWCMRFKRKGWGVVFVPDARIIHIGGVCSRGRPFFVEWHKHRGMLRFYRKFFHPHYPNLLWCLVVVGVWFRFAAMSTYCAGRLAISRVGGVRE